MMATPVNNTQGVLNMFNADMYRMNNKRDADTAQVAAVAKEIDKIQKTVVPASRIVMIACHDRVCWYGSGGKSNHSNSHARVQLA